MDATDASASKSVDEPEVDSNLVSMEFDNRGCDCAWKLFWLDASGARRQYGEVQPDTVYVQGTFPGHIWHLEAAAGAQAAGEKAVRYAAVAGPAACVAHVREDAKCRRVETNEVAAAAA